jgi:hypothetical protein
LVRHCTQASSLLQKGVPASEAHWPSSRQAEQVPSTQPLPAGHSLADRHDTQVFELGSHSRPPVHGVEPQPLTQAYLVVSQACAFGHWALVAHWVQSPKSIAGSLGLVMQFGSPVSWQSALLRHSTHSGGETSVEQWEKEEGHLPQAPAVPPLLVPLLELEEVELAPVLPPDPVVPEAPATVPLLVEEFPVAVGRAVVPVVT